MDHYYEAKIDHHHHHFHMLREIVKEERRDLRARINLFNKSKLPYSEINYLFISKVVGSKIRQKNDKDTAEKSTPQVNNAKRNKAKLTLHNKIPFKDAVGFLPHSSFRILSHKIEPDSTSNKYNSTVQQQSSRKTEAMKVNAIMEQLDKSDRNGYWRKNNSNNFESLYESYNEKGTNHRTKPNTSIIVISEEENGGKNKGGRNN